MRAVIDHLRICLESADILYIYRLEKISVTILSICIKFLLVDPRFEIQTGLLKKIHYMQVIGISAEWHKLPNRQM